MTAKEVYSNALALLGYTDNPDFQRRAIPVFNKIYYELHRIIYGAKEFEPIKSLSDRLNLPDKVLFAVMPAGIAEQIALGEGDGELQQYFALDYDRAKAKLNCIDKVYDTMP